jgi:hypothetical protein
MVKVRDCEQCQICGDRRGDPYTVLHAHHIIARAKSGPDDDTNLITLCDLCHAVVTPRWHKGWFPNATVEELEQNREDYEWFLTLPTDRRVCVRDSLWATFGIV